MKRIKKIAQLTDIVIQMLLLLAAFAFYTKMGNEDLGSKALVTLFTWQLFSCIIQLKRPVILIRKIYHRMLLLLFILCAIPVILYRMMDITIGLWPVLILLYGVVLLMICYMLLTYYELFTNNGHHEE
jgi:uncharacterized membrane protein